MVREEQTIQKSRSFHFRKMFDHIPGRQSHSLTLDKENEKEDAEEEDHKPQTKSQCAKIAPVDIEQIGSAFDKTANNEKGPVCRMSNGSNSRPASPKAKEKANSDMELMKERFAKLLLGEDMSGGGKGVSSALALSNAITNLAASVFGEQWKLEPMSLERQHRWRKEVDWLLSVTDHIVEFVPSQQKGKDGTDMEIMVTQQRKDLLMNIPALKKLDAMLIDCLDNFKDQKEFWYVSRDADESEKGVQRNDKWWLPTVKVPPEGLSDATRKWLQYQKDCVNQVLKASMAINAQILSEMEVPDNYIESLPKNGRASLGDSIYKNITVEFFDPEQFLSTMDMTTEHKTLDLKNRIEASIVIWKRKMHCKDNKSSWSSAISLEKRELFEERAETILLLLKHRFPGLPQSTLDISKIQYNKDVGHAILESYSRVLESLANTVTNRIEDVLYADSLSQEPPPVKTSSRNPSMDLSAASPGPGTFTPIEDQTPAETPTSMTLSDFMGWSLDSGETDMNKSNSIGNLEAFLEDSKEKPSVVSTKKFSYIDKLEGGLRSPAARH